jgi:hypothetical protein
MNTLKTVFEAMLNDSNSRVHKEKKKEDFKPFTKNVYPRQDCPEMRFLTPKKPLNVKKGKVETFFECTIKENQQEISNIFITNEHNTSQTCVYCFEKLCPPTAVMNGKVKSIRGAFLVLESKMSFYLSNGLVLTAVWKYFSLI